VLAGLAELGGTGQLVQRLTGSVFGAVTIIAIGLIARRLAGPRAGLIAAGVAAVYPILVTADGALMSESLYGALVAGALLTAYALVEAPSVPRGVGLGVLLGLAALTRGEALILVVLLLVPVVRRPRGRSAALATVVAALAVLAPWTIRNLTTFHRLVPVSTDAGAVVGGANCQPTYYGGNIGGWNILCDPPYPGNEAEQTARQQAKGVRYARHHLGRLPIVAGARLLRQWSFYRPFQANPGRSPGWQRAGVVVYWALLVPAAYGLLVLRRRRRVPLGIIVCPILLACIQAVLIYGYLRFRHPAEISIVVLAAVGLEALAVRMTGRRSAPAPAAA
jgi:4-amino-4-deoxy-L-arabinose transferase-like glycosyltransferase